MSSRCLGRANGHERDEDKIASCSLCDEAGYIILQDPENHIREALLRGRRVSILRQGVTQDYVQTHLWYNLAAAQGNELARKNRDIVAKKMTSAQIAEAQRLAREWKPKKQ